MTSSGEVGAKHLAAGQVLAALSRELRGVAHISDQLQFDISEVLKDYGGETPIRIYQLQNLDRVTQMVAGLADFVDGLANSAPPDLSLEVLGAAKLVSMADLADRLSRCEAPSENDMPSKAKAGDCAFF